MGDSPFARTRFVGGRSIPLPLYCERAPFLAGVTGREHTGQVPVEERIEREEAFRRGRLAALFCSPTFTSISLKLGVDIADLAVVHLRNVPPTPVNYAQRSGRAGHGGRPALVLTFCSQGNAHDQYFYRRRERMIAGAVAPARLDLANQDLVEAHLHSVWLATVGLRLGASMVDVLDLDVPDYPLMADKAAQLELPDQRRHEIVEAFRTVIGHDGQMAGRQWYTGEWLEEKVREDAAPFRPCHEPLAGDVPRGSGATGGGAVQSTSPGCRARSARPPSSASERPSARLTCS